MEGFEIYEPAGFTIDPAEIHPEKKPREKKIKATDLCVEPNEILSGIGIKIL